MDTEFQWRKLSENGHVDDQEKEYNIKMNLRDIGCAVGGGWNCIRIMRNSVRWCQVRRTTSLFLPQIGFLRPHCCGLHLKYFRVSVSFNYSDPFHI
jgi:hypothetical protein